MVSSSHPWVCFLLGLTLDCPLPLDLHGRGPQGRFDISIGVVFSFQRKQGACQGSFLCGYIADGCSTACVLGVDLVPDRPSRSKAWSNHKRAVAVHEDRFANETHRPQSGPA